MCMYGFLHYEKKAFVNRMKNTFRHLKRYITLKSNADVHTTSVSISMSHVGDWCTLSHILHTSHTVKIMMNQQKRQLYFYYYLLNVEYFFPLCLFIFFVPYFALPYRAFNYVYKYVLNQPIRNALWCVSWAFNAFALARKRTKDIPTMSVNIARDMLHFYTDTR